MKSEDLTSGRGSSFHRREILRAGLTGFTALSLPELFAHRAAADSTSPVANNSKRTALILVWLPGGHSHLETYDPKPKAPSEYRGLFNPIATNVSGIDLCELLPRHAQVADKFSILRSVVHTGFCHQQGTHQLLTGHPVLELKLKPDDPDCFSIANSLRPNPNRSLPNYVGVPPVNYSGAAYLGSSFEPFAVYGDPNQPSFEVPNIGMKPEAAARLQTRIDLRKNFDSLRREIDQRQNMKAFDTFEAQAWNVLTSNETKAAFDLSREDPQTRDRYGRNTWGQRMLLCRRLVEAGVDLVTTQCDGALCGRVGNWDDHAVNHNCFEAMKYRCQFFDQAVATLIEDLHDRGLSDRVLLVVTGEFGRTPKISYQPSTGEGIGSAPAGTVQPGRDHWPSATSILFSGGGLRGGQVIGSTDARGEYVTEGRATTGDFLATLYRHLGIDADEIQIRNFSGRPVPILQGGKAITQLTATRSSDTTADSQ